MDAPPQAWADAIKQLRHIRTPEALLKIDQTIDELINEAGSGTVYLIVARGQLKWVQKGPRLVITE
ncbi:MAG: hypothetical protein J7M34_12830 [Anaerolineae bacterium]|nr:hypothetical protein [Anaerolineae bacterium]